MLIIPEAEINTCIDLVFQFPSDSGDLIGRSLARNRTATRMEQNNQSDLSACKLYQKNNCGEMK